MEQQQEPGGRGPKPPPLDLGGGRLVQAPSVGTHVQLLPSPVSGQVAEAVAGQVVSQPPMSWPQYASAFNISNEDAGQGPQAGEEGAPQQHFPAAAASSSQAPPSAGYAFGYAFGDYSEGAAEAEEEHVVGIAGMGPQPVLPGSFDAPVSMAQGLELMGRDARLLHPDSDLEFMQYVPYQFKAGRDYVYVWGPGRHGQLSPIKLLRFDVAMASRCGTTDPLLAPPPMPYQGGLISSPDSINLGEAVYGAPALGWAAAGEGVAAAAAATGGGDGNGGRQVAQAASPEDMDLGSTPSSAAAAEPEYGAAGDGNFAAAAAAEGGSTSVQPQKLLPAFQQAADEDAARKAAGTAAAATSSAPTSGTAPGGVGAGAGGSRVLRSSGGGRGGAATPGRGPSPSPVSSAGGGRGGTGGKAGAVGAYNLRSSSGLPTGQPVVSDVTGAAGGVHAVEVAGRGAAAGGGKPRAGAAAGRGTPHERTHAMGTRTTPNPAVTNIGTTGTTGGAARLATGSSAAGLAGGTSSDAPGGRGGGGSSTKAEAKPLADAVAGTKDRTGPSANTRAWGSTGAAAARAATASTSAGFKGAPKEQQKQAGPRQQPSSDPVTESFLAKFGGTNLTYSRGPVFLVELLNKCSTKRDATDEAECLEPMTFWLALRSQLYLAAHGIRTGSSGDAGNGGILDQGGSGGSAGASSSGGGGGAAGDGGVEVAQVVKAQAKEVIQKELQGLLADNNRRLLLRHLESCQVFLGKVVDLVKDESVLNPPTTLKLVPSKATPGRRG